PSTIHPPGKRIKPGFRSANVCTISARNPFLRPCQVSVGNNEIISRSIVPSPSNQICRFAFCSVLLDVKLTSWYRHCLLSCVILSSVLPIAVPALSTHSTRNVIPGFCCRYHTENSYVLPWFTPIPRKPSLRNPMAVLVFLSTRKYRGLPVLLICLFRMR